MSSDEADPADDEIPPRPSMPSVPWREESEFAATFLAQVIDSVGHPVFVKDRQFRLLLLNRALCDMIGRTRDELLGKTDYDLFPRAEADFFRMKDTEMFSRGARVEIEEEFLTDASGKRHVLATTKVPLVDERGEVTHLIGIISDITRLKVAEESLRQTNEDLERRVEERTRALETAQQELVRKERLAVLGRLAGGVAHQIRNPLGVINNAAYVLERELKHLEGAGQARQALTIIHDEVARANRIIKGLMEYARVRAPVRSPERLCDLVQVTLSRVTLPANVAVDNGAADEVAPVAVDHEQICTALENIVNNAIDAMPHGGRLELTVEKRASGMVLTVRDSGQGIPREVHERLFEPLVTTKVNGLGLGLVTARTLIEGQGGRLRAVPQGPRGGAVFEIELPPATR